MGIFRGESRLSTEKSEFSSLQLLGGLLSSE